jgi:ferredoxin-thioredoxin reductase catalytic subunit/rhodanese-related sulfurtransferase
MDINSPEFKAEHEKTLKFTKKVTTQFGFEFNPNADICEGVHLGLTRHKLLHNKRYCPCFIPQFDGNDRICPCKPALEEEIPTQGHCHCMIFCTPEYAKSQMTLEQAEEDAHNNSQMLSKEECEELLKKENISSDELVALLEARENGVIKFLLVDVREQYEYDSERIKGVDKLMPTTLFFNEIKKYDDSKDEYIVLYCRTGTRTNQVKYMMRSDFGFSNVSHLEHGILSFYGTIEK